MSFTDRKPFVVSTEDLARYKRIRKQWHCSLCGHNFEQGDTVRWIFANGTKGQRTGNFFVCTACDGVDEEVLARANESYAQAVKLSKQWGIYGPDWQHDHT